MYGASLNIRKSFKTRWRLKRVYDDNIYKILANLIRLSFYNEFNQREVHKYKLEMKKSGLNC